MSLPVEVHEQSAPSKIGMGVGVGFAVRRAAAAEGQRCRRWLLLAAACRCCCWPLAAGNVFRAAFQRPGVSSLADRSPTRPPAAACCRRSALLQAGALMGAVTSNWGDIPNVRQAWEGEDWRGS